MVMIEVDENKCDGCGECVDVCPAEVYELNSSKSKVMRPEDCTECCSCVEVCPQEAITHSSC